MIHDHINHTLREMKAINAETGEPIVAPPFHVFEKVKYEHPDVLTEASGFEAQACRFCGHQRIVKVK